MYFPNPLGITLTFTSITFTFLFYSSRFFDICFFLIASLRNFFDLVFRKTTSFCRSLSQATFDLQKKCFFFLPTLLHSSRQHLRLHNRCLHIYYESTSCIHGSTFSCTCIHFQHNQSRKNHFPGLLSIPTLFCKFCRCFLNSLVWVWFSVVSLGFHELYPQSKC